VKLFSNNFNLCNHDTSTSRIDGRRDGRLAVAIPRSAISLCYKCRVMDRPAWQNYLSLLT